LYTWGHRKLGERTILRKQRRDNQPMRQGIQLPSGPAAKVPAPPSPRPALPLRSPTAQRDPALSEGQSSEPLAAGPLYPDFLRGLEDAPDYRSLQRQRVQRALQRSLHRDEAIAAPEPSGLGTEPRSAPSSDPVLQRVIEVAPT